MDSSHVVCVLGCFRVLSPFGAIEKAIRPWNSWPKRRIGIILWLVCILSDLLMWLGSGNRALLRCCRAIEGLFRVHWTQNDSSGEESFRRVWLTWFHSLRWDFVVLRTMYLKLEGDGEWGFQCLAAMIGLWQSKHSSFGCLPPCFCSKRSQRSFPMFDLSKGGIWAKVRWIEIEFDAVRYEIWWLWGYMWPLQSCTGNCLQPSDNGYHRWCWPKFCRRCEVNQTWVFDGPLAG